MANAIWEDLSGQIMDFDQDIQDVINGYNEKDAENTVLSQLIYEDLYEQTADNNVARSAYEEFLKQ